MFKAVIKRDVWEPPYRCPVSERRGLQPLLAAMMARRVTGALIGIMSALGFIGWVWNFLIAV